MGRGQQKEQPLRRGSLGVTAGDEGQDEGQDPGFRRQEPAPHPQL